MIRNILVMCALLSAGALSVNAQEPVQWTFAAQKVDNNLFEIHLSARIQPGWHIYARQQPAEAFSIPTTIQFSDSSSVLFKGELKEEGKKVPEKDPALGVEQIEYFGTVDFIQIVQLKKAGDEYTLSGALQYQACDGNECLQPKTVNFSLKLLPDKVAVK